MIGKRNHMHSFRKVSEQAGSVASLVARQRKCSEKVLCG